MNPTGPARHPHGAGNPAQIAGSSAARNIGFHISVPTPHRSYAAFSSPWAASRTRSCASFSARLSTAMTGDIRP
jgi:hypothetical protein